MSAGRRSRLLYGGDAFSASAEPNRTVSVFTRNDGLLSVVWCWTDELMWIEKRRCHVSVSFLKKTDWPVVLCSSLPLVCAGGARTPLKNSDREIDEFMNLELTFIVNAYVLARRLNASSKDELLCSSRLIIYQGEPWHSVSLNTLLVQKVKAQKEGMPPPLSENLNTYLFCSGCCLCK